MKKIILALISSQFLFGCGGSGHESEKPEITVEQPNIDDQIHNEIPTVNYQVDGVEEWINFSHHQAIAYTKDMLLADFNASRAWIGTNQEDIDGVAKIIDVNGDMKLAITSLKDQIKVGIYVGKDLTEANELYFLYELTFNADYDFAKGGKLPGLGGLNLSDDNEVKPTGCRVEGQLAGRGFSLRSMFREDGRAILYAYHQNNPNIALGDSNACGEAFAYQHNGKDFFFQKTKTYLIEQYVKINDANQENGIVTIHVNGFKVLEKTDMVLSENGMYGINQLFIDIWHGGNDSDWAPSVNSTVVIDNIVLSDTPLTYQLN
jgi:hypothetical protein